MILRRETATSLYDKFMFSNGINKPIIHEYYHSFLKSICKSNTNTHPSEILTMYNFLTIDEYCEIMTEHYNRKILNIEMSAIEASGDFEVFDLRKLLLSEELKARLTNDIKEVGNKFNLIPVAIQDGSEGLCLNFILKEPETTEKDERFLASSYSYNQNDTNLDELNQYANIITQKCNLRKYNITMVANPTYKNIVKYLNRNTNTNYLFNEIEFDIPIYTRKILIDGIVKGASDIFIWGSSNGGKYFIEYCYTILNDTLTGEMLECTLADLKMMTSTVWKWSGINESSRVDFSVRYYNIDNLLGDHDNEIRFKGRLNIMPDDASSDKFCIRVVPVNKAIIDFDVFKLSPTVKQHLADNVYYNDSGIIVISGSTGSGKSTLLRSLLMYLKKVRPTHRIESVEAPIEAILPGICQINIDDKNQLTANDIAIALTRRNPKIINLNEINTPELFKFCNDASLMQNLVLTTLHSSNVSSVPDRILGLLTESTKYLFRQFFNQAKMLIHLTMLKEACNDCCEMVSIKDDPRITQEMITLMRTYGYNDDMIYMPKMEVNQSCPHCKGRGFIIDKPIVCTEYIVLSNMVKRLLKRTLPEDMGFKIKDLMMRNGTTGVHDAIKFMKDQKVTWNRIFEQFSLYNEYDENLKDDEMTFEDKMLLSGGR